MWITEEATVIRRDGDRIVHAHKCALNGHRWHRMVKWTAFPTIDKDQSQMGYGVKVYKPSELVPGAWECVGTLTDAYLQIEGVEAKGPGLNNPQSEGEANMLAWLILEIAGNWREENSVPAEVVVGSVDKVRSVIWDIVQAVKNGMAPK